MVIIESKRRGTSKGVVTIEFIMLFPVIVAMLYAAAVYGVVFFSKYQMQSAVDRAVSTALYVDRSAYASDGSGVSVALGNAVVSRAQTALADAVAHVPLSGLKADNACALESLSNDVEVVHCTLTYTKVGSIVPVMRFGMLGEFPPLPAQLQVQARAAF